MAKIFKPDDVALVKGSTFLLTVDVTGEQRVRNWMQQVRTVGIGIRRSEGFGRVCFDEPLHIAMCRKSGGPL